MEIICCCNVVHLSKKPTDLLSSFSINYPQFSGYKVFDSNNYLVFADLIPARILSIGIVDLRCFDAVVRKQNCKHALCGDGIQSDISFIFETDYKCAAIIGLDLYDQTHFPGIWVFFLIVIPLQFTKNSTFSADAIVLQDGINIICCN